MFPEDVFTCTWDDFVRLQSVPVTAVGFVRLNLTPLAGGTTPAPTGKTSSNATRASSVTEGAAADQLVEDVGSPPLHDCGGPLALIV